MESSLFLTQPSRVHLYDSPFTPSLMTIDILLVLPWNYLTDLLVFSFINQLNKVFDRLILYLYESYDLTFKNYSLTCFILCSSKYLVWWIYLDIFLTLVLLRAQSSIVWISKLPHMLLQFLGWKVHLISRISNQCSRHQFSFLISWSSLRALPFLFFSCIIRNYCGVVKSAHVGTRLSGPEHQFSH